VIPLQTAPTVGLERTVVVAVGLVLASLLVSVVVLTLGLSVYAARRRRRRNAVRESLHDELLTRLYDPDGPEWGAWVGTLDGVERSVLERLLEDYLRRLEGSDAETLRALGDALGIEERERARRNARDEFVRLRALTWLTLLRAPSDDADTERPRTRRERAAVARWLHETDASPERGVDVLLGEADEPLSAFGVDTLYRLTERRPEAVVAAAQNHPDWPADLITQVLLVCRHVESGVASTDLSWVVSLLEHEVIRVRIEAALTLATFGWRDPITDRVFLERLTDDESPLARAAAYTMLGRWGDPESTAVLQRALGNEPNDRARLAGARALVTASVPEAETPEPARPARRWAAEHRHFDERAARPLADGGRRRES
jgi:hypothetical protein